LPPRALTERLERTQVIPLSEFQPDIASWERPTCRICGLGGLIEVLNLGEQPPANAFVSPQDADKPEAKYPLSLRPAKQGLLIPGTHQKILPPSELGKLKPDVLLLLAWNHAPEILARETEFKARGGRFLTPNLEEL
jgi:C-methyltransferase-like protein/putative zinc binding protein